MPGSLPACDGSDQSDPAFDPYRPSDGPDEDLLQVSERFRTIDRKLDDLVVREDDEASEEELMSLHEQWANAILKVCLLTAKTEEGQRSKAAVLRAALKVVCGE